MVRQSGTVIAILVICAAATRPNVMTSLGVEPMGQIIRAKDKAMDKDLPGTEFDDKELANQFGTMPDGFEAFNLEGFVKEVHNLYYDASPQANEEGNQYQEQYVHFHNWDHGRNVFAFTKWYIDTGKSGFSAEEKFLIMIAALAHDVMHPGTPNSRGMVEESFLGKVKSWRNSDWTLDQYASDLLKSIADPALGDGGTKAMRLTISGALGCGENDIVAKAPQEVLHAWITIQLLKKYKFPDNKDSLTADRLQKVAIPILMTSIVAHFGVFLRDQEAGIKNHVVATNGIPQKLGLLLHFFDMGYICQSSTYPLAGIRFAARYLVESNNNPHGLSDKEQNVKGPLDFAKVVGGQVWFGKTIVGQYLDALHTAGVIHKDVFPELESGLNSFLGLVNEANVIDPDVLESLASGWDSFLAKDLKGFQHELQQEIKVGKNLQTEAFKSLT